MMSCWPADGLAKAAELIEARKGWLKRLLEAVRQK
jgi:hypothetical protein